ncbi:MAG: hypothetical protein IJC78_02660 [Clostridia bacterium]|nr:hypothetical protein [Clostridia bacterium]
MLIQRMSVATQTNPAYVDAFIEKIKENPGSVDEVWLYAHYGYPSIEKHRESGAALVSVAEKFRRAGVRVSLQISNSLGHGLYMSKQDCSGLVYPGSPVRNMVGPDGTVAEYAFCPNDSYFEAYILEELAAYAAIRPDCVWLDDDFRARNHAPVMLGCFCDSCIASFNAEYGYSFSRTGLVSALHEDGNDVRGHWIAFGRKSWHDLMLKMCKSFTALSPESAFGLEDSPMETYAVGYGREHIYSAISEGTGKAPRSRPGGGAYDDDNPTVFIDKAADVDFQMSVLPKDVTFICPEIESLPDVMYGKSIGGTCLETTLYLARGATAMSYAIMGNTYESLDWHGEMLAAFSKRKAYWEKLVAVNKESERSGLSIIYGKEGWRFSADRSAGTGKYAWAYSESVTPFDWAILPMQGFDFMDMSIPMACKNTGDVFFLEKNHATRLTDAEIREYMKKPCLVDGETLMAFMERGFSFSVTAKKVNALKEKLYCAFASHPLTGTPHSKTFPAAFLSSQSIALFPKGNGKCEPLAKLAVLGTGEEKYILNALIETESGATWAVYGNGFSHTHTSSDLRRQYVNVLDAISEQKFSAIQETPFKTQIYTRENASGKTVCVSVLNRTVGDSGAITLRIRRPAGETVTFMTALCDEMPLPFAKDGEDILVDIPNIRGWDVGTVFIA